MDDWVWGIIVVVVAAVIFFLILHALNRGTKRVGQVSREEFNIIAGRVNVLWALLAAWLLMNLLYFLYLYFVGTTKYSFFRF